MKSCQVIAITNAAKSMIEFILHVLFKLHGLRPMFLNLLSELPTSSLSSTDASTDSRHLQTEPEALPLSRAPTALSLDRLSDRAAAHVICG